VFLNNFVTVLVSGPKNVKVAHSFLFTVLFRGMHSLKKINCLKQTLLPKVIIARLSRIEKFHYVVHNDH
jgi:hypothetical protein